MIRTEFIQSLGLSNSQELMLYRTCGKVFKEMADDVQNDTEQAVAQMDVVSTKQHVVLSDKIDGHTFVPPLVTPYPELSEFLARDQLIMQYTWTPNMVEGQLFNTTNQLYFPNAYLSRSSNTLLRMRGTLYASPDTNITISVNGSTASYGTLLIQVIPLPTILNNAYSNYFTATGGEWYMLDVSESNSLKFTVPYRTMFPRMDLTAPDLNNSRMLFNLNIYVSVPLSAFASSTDSASINVYANLTNLRLCGVTNTPAIAQMDGGHEAIQKTKENTTVSTIMQDISDLTASFSTIPAIGTYAAAVSTSTAGLSKFFQKMGYSVPTNVSSNIHTQRRFPMLCKSDDLPSTTVLGPSQDLSSPKDSRLVHDSADSMSILHIVQQPFQIYSGNITNSDLVTYKAFDWWVSPSCMFFDNRIHSASFSSVSGGLVTYYPSHACELATMCNLWRGSVRLCFSFVASMFHRCRVRIVWDPCQKATVMTDTSSYVESYSHVVDICGRQDVSFTIPYLCDTNWLQTSGPYTTFGAITTGPGTNQSIGYGWANGRVTMFLESLVNGGNSSVSPVYFQVFASGGSDFEFASPSMGHSLERGRPYVAYAQMRTSYKTIAEADYKPFVGNGVGFSDDGINTQLRITSVRQLANMLTPVWHNPDDAGNFLNATPKTPNSGITIFPANSYDFYQSNTTFSNGATTYTSHGNVWVRANYFRRIMAMYMFNRGSVRYVLIPNVGPQTKLCIPALTITTPNPNDNNCATEAGNYMAQVAALRQEGTATTSMFISYSTVASSGLVPSDDIFLAKAPELYDASASLAFFALNNESPIDFTVPYSSIYQCMHNSVRPKFTLNDSQIVNIVLPYARVREVFYSTAATNNGVPFNLMRFPQSGNITRPDGTSVPINDMGLYTATSIEMVLFEAAGDDFIFGVLLPPLPMQASSNSSNPPLRRRRDVDELTDGEIEAALKDGVTIDTIVTTTTPTPKPKTKYAEYIKRFKNYTTRRFPKRFRGGVIESPFDRAYHSYSLGLPFSDDVELPEEAPLLQSPR